jgi:antitoxin ParD1/3/4
MPTRNINLTDHYHQFVDEQVEAGRFKNASEVLRAALRLLEQHSRAEEQKLAALKMLAADGFKSLDHGLGLSLSGDACLEDAVARIGERVAKSTAVRCETQRAGLDQHLLDPRLV